MWFGGRIGYRLDRKACQDCIVIIVIVVMVIIIIILIIVIVIVIIVIVIYVLTRCRRAIGLDLSE